MNIVIAKLATQILFDEKSFKRNSIFLCPQPFTLIHSVDFIFLPLFARDDAGVLLDGVRIRIIITRQEIF